MKHRKLNRIIAAVMFLAAEIVFLSTMSPTFSFWDCGEVIATSYTLGIPHPPGAPLFLLTGHLFSMLPFFHDIGARINLVSTLESSATVMLAYLIIVRLIAIYRSSDPDQWSLPEKISAYGGAVIGALALAFSDSFWFNAVETGLWAASSFITATILWMMLCWYDEDPAPGSERWLLAVMYMMGLSIGVHLLCMLALFALVLLYYFKKYEVRGADFTQHVPIFIIGTLIFYVLINSVSVRIWPSGFSGPLKTEGLVYAFLVMVVPITITHYLIKRYGQGLKSAISFLAISIFVIVICVVLRMFVSVDLVFFVLFAYCTFLIYYVPRTFVWLVWGSLAFFFLIYRGIIKELPVLLLLTSWWGVGALILLLVFGIYYTHKRRLFLPNLALMSVLLLILGYTSYLLIFVRAHAGPPINENNPSTLDAFFSYVNREQYGEWPLWPRRWSPEPAHQYFYERYSGDLDYFFRYQLEHMYLRYFGWQFIGRSADIEGAVVDWGKLWGLPFLVGAVGATAHFKRHWKSATVVGALFVMTGLVLVVYLNQTEPQPRERDYSYVGSFFAFALWIGIGIESLFTRISEKMTPGEPRRTLWISAGIVAAGLLLINGRMLQANYRTHDRSGNYVAWDWAWNILQSCEKDAILFTNGDNDTFPLWYLQEVERIRTDVRIVNLSLANTGWYMLQLKHESPRGAKPIEIGVSDADLAEFKERYEPVDSLDVVLPAGIEPRKLLQVAQRSGTLLPGGQTDSLRWRLVPSQHYKGQTYMRPQDFAVFHVILGNYSQRPIYFALTVDPEAMIGLEKHLRLDGLVYKVVPLRSRNSMSFVDPGMLYGNLFKTYRYRNTNNPGINIEETSRNMAGNYPPLFVRLALELSSSPRDSVRVPGPSGVAVARQRGSLALDVLDRLTLQFPLERYQVSSRLASSAVSIYSTAGAKEKAYPYIHYLEVMATQSDVQQDPELFYSLAKAYRSVGRDREALVIMEKLKRSLPEIKKQLDSLKQ